MKSCWALQQDFIIKRRLRCKKKVFFLILILYSQFTYADKITIYNKTPNQIFVATYYEKNNKAKQIGKIEKIDSSKTAELKRPSRKFGYNRKLIFSTTSKNLKDNFDEKSYKKLPKTGIGQTLGNNFYIAFRNNELKGFNKLNWNIRTKILDNLINRIRDKLKDHPYSKKVSTVRTSNTLCQEELSFKKARAKNTKDALENFLGTKLSNNKIPTIAFCCSGGGYRAMISSLGLFRGAEKIKLLDCATYMAGLSGSSYFIAPWLYSKQNINKYSKTLKTIVRTDLKKTKIDILNIIKQIIPKYLFNQPITSVDIYGALLVNKIFNYLEKNQRFAAKLSHLTKSIENGQNLLPILTAIEPGKKDAWFEFTPYEIGEPYNRKSFVPTWAFGRKFVNNKSISFAPEQSLGYYMGIWASAYTIEIKKIIKSKLNRLPAKFKSHIMETQGDKRLSPAKVYNYTYKADTKKSSTQKTTLVDAGLDFNLPFPPLLRPERKIDIIIVCDASASVYKGSPAMVKAEKWAKDNNLFFPKINYSEINKKNISVYKDKTNANCPTIIYIPLIKNENYNKNFDPVKEIKNGFCNTFNFKYTEKEFDLLSGLMEFNIIKAKEIIQNAIKEKILQ